MRTNSTRGLCGCPRWKSIVILAISCQSASRLVGRQRERMFGQRAHQIDHQFGPDDFIELPDRPVGCGNNLRPRRTTPGDADR